MLQVITFSRIIQVFILFFGGGIFFLIIAMLILKRQRNSMTHSLSLFFIFIFIGGLFNAIYVILTPHVSEPTVCSLHFITYFFFCFAQIFLLIFNLIILRSDRIISIKKRLSIIISYAGLLWLLILIPGGIMINEHTYYRPQWNLTFFIFANVIWMGFAMIPTIITSIKVYRSIDDKVLRKKWLFYFIGTLMIYVELFGVGVCIYINDPMLRLMWNIYDLSVFLGAIMIYYGVGRQS
ncbi:MAG: hypothetical protein EU552_02925 [Promethearchaeota archaeon]|nr:MAG: hypothetical protein EU552_02925 [Candidatus Lokiarchaeota archaeon]